MQLWPVTKQIAEVFGHEKLGSPLVFAVDPLLSFLGRDGMVAGLIYGGQRVGQQAFA